MFSAKGLTGINLDQASQQSSKLIFIIENHVRDTNTCPARGHAAFYIETVASALDWSARGLAGDAPFNPDGVAEKAAVRALRLQEPNEGHEIWPRP